MVLARSRGNSDPAGDPALAKQQLGWQPTTTLDEMIAEMVASDLATARKNRLLRDSGYTVNHARE